MEGDTDSLSTSEAPNYQIAALSPAVRKALQNSPISISPEDALQVAKEGIKIQARKIYPIPPVGKAHMSGKPINLTCILNDKPCIMTFDTGATPSVIMASYLAERDPTFKEKLLPTDVGRTKGFGGSCEILGVYPCNIELPHPNGTLVFEMEFLVLQDTKAPFPMILGRDYQILYAINVYIPPDAQREPYVHIGKYNHKYAISEGIHKTMHSPPVAANKNDEYFIPPIEPFPAITKGVSYSDFLKILQEPEQTANELFLDTLKDANINPNLAPEQVGQIRKLILAHQNVWALPGVQYKFAQLGEHVHLDANIPTPMPKGLKKAPYPLSNKARIDVRKTVQDMLARDLIRPSKSPYAAPTFVVYRGSKIRVIHDWREMNQYLRVPAHPIPNMQALIRALTHTKYFTSIDIMDAFFLMHLDEKSKELTAFVTEDGLWEWNVCSFGLSPFPGEFTKRINHELQVQLFQEWLKAYIDDILAKAKTWAECLWQMHIVLSILERLGCRAKLSKAFFAMPEITWVGHKLNGLSLTLDDNRVAVVTRWEPPKTRHQLQRFLGFTGYHQQFIPNYALIASPLSELLSPAIPYDWTDKQTEGFEALKNALAKAVVLYMPDFTKPFLLYTDASDVGLAGALYQKDTTDTERPIVFISRKLRDAETRYGASNLECLAVVWALDKLHFYLDGAVFTVITDCVAVRSLLTAKWTHRQLVRWQAAIQAYRGKITIIHRAGKLAFNVDPPSRDGALPNDATNPAADLDPDPNIEIGGVNIVFQTAGITSPFQIGGNPTEPRSRVFDDVWPQTQDKLQEYLDRPLNALDLPYYCAEDIIDSDVQVAAVSSSGLSPEFTRKIIAHYSTDTVFAKIVGAICENTISLKELLNDVSLPPLVVRDLKDKRFFALDGLLYRQNGLTSALVITDPDMQTLVLDTCHDHLLGGHQGTDKTFERIREIAWWPSLRKSVESYIATCQACQGAKRRTGKTPGLLQEIESPTRPWQHANLDFVTALPVAGELDFNAAIVLTDRYSRAVIVIPTHENADAFTTARRFICHAFPRTGLPEKLISDRDPKFTADFWKTVHRILGTRLAMSTAHHAQTDGLAERFIGTLEEALRAFCAFGNKIDIKDQEIDWTDVVPMWTYAFNSSMHASTKQMPYILELGRVPRGITEILQSSLPLKKVTIDPNGKEWADVLKQAAERAKDCLADAFNYNKERFDKKHKAVKYMPGDKARISTKYFDYKGTPGKLKPAWTKPFEVVKMIGNNAVELKLEEPYHLRHPVFPVLLLEKTETSPERFASRRPFQVQPPPIEGADGEELFLVEYIRAERSRKVKGKMQKQYLVHWKGYPVEDDSWEPEENIYTAEALEIFKSSSGKKVRK